MMNFIHIIEKQGLVEVYCLIIYIQTIVIILLGMMFLMMRD